MKNLREIGELLKKTRNKKGLTLEKVYKKTRIHTGVLRSLEEGKTEGLLSKVYAKAFLRKYCDFLDLDTDLMLREYEKNFPDTEEQKIYVDKTAPLDNIKYIKIAVSILLVIIFIMFVSNSISKMKSFLTRPRKESASLAKRQEDMEPQRGKEISSTALPISLSIQNNEDVWMLIKKDGDIVFDGILPKNSRESWTANKRFDLRVGKLEAVNFTVNKKNLGKVGSGVKNITIDKEGLKIGSKKIN